MMNLPSQPKIMTAEANRHTVRKLQYEDRGPVILIKFYRDSVAKRLLRRQKMSTHCYYITFTVKALCDALL